MPQDDYEEGEICDRRRERSCRSHSAHKHHRHHSRSHHSHYFNDKSHSKHHSHSRKRGRRSISSKRRKIELKDGTMKSSEIEDDNKMDKRASPEDDNNKKKNQTSLQNNNNNNNSNDNDSDSPLEDISLFDDNEEKEKEAEKRRERLLMLLSQTKEKEEEKIVENTETTKEENKVVENKVEKEKEMVEEVEIKTESVKKEENEKDNKKIEIGFDMFSDDIPEANNNKYNSKNSNNPDNSNNNIQLTDSNSEMFDNDEGYYICRVGELFYNRYRVLGEFGKGVFSTVLKCEDTLNNNFNVAIKVTRSNEIMTKDAQKEVKTIELISQNDPQHNKHCMRILDTFTYRKHFCIVFNIMSMNLRELLNKYGRNVGLHLDAVKVYGYQLFTALKHIHSINIIHADLKPDNILVNEEKNSIQLADFGSAIFTNGPNDVTPYLVSRYYRAPEVILGLKYSCPIDIWSAGCCLYELYTGDVMFPGSSNNEMIKLFQEVKGPFSKKLISQHHTAYDLLKKCYYFVDGYFLYQTVDVASGLPKIEKKKYDPSRPERDIKKELLAKANKSENKQNPLKRITAEEALKHPFFIQDDSKIVSTPTTPRN